MNINDIVTETIDAAIKQAKDDKEWDDIYPPTINIINNITYRNTFCVLIDGNNISNNKFLKYSEAIRRARMFFDVPEKWNGNKVEYSAGKFIEIKIVPTRRDW